VGMLNAEYQWLEQSIFAQLHERIVAAINSVSRCVIFTILSFSLP